MMQPVSGRLFRGCPDPYWLYLRQLYESTEGYLAKNVDVKCYSPCDWAIDDALSISPSLQWNTCGKETIPRLIGGTRCKCHCVQRSQALHLCHLCTLKQTPSSNQVKLMYKMCSPHPVMVHSAQSLQQIIVNMTPSSTTNICHLIFFTFSLEYLLMGNMINIYLWLHSVTEELQLL